MRPYTFSEVLALNAQLNTDGVTSVAEPATGAVSLEANAHEEFEVEVAGFNGVAGAVSASVQYYGKLTNDGDVSATWTKVGATETAGVADPLALALRASGTGIFAGKVSLNRLNLPFKYVTAIVTLTHPDDNAAGAFTVTLRGVGAGRE